MALIPHNPRLVSRTDEQQRQVDAETATLALYFYETCGFCIRVIRVIERLRLKIELRNIRTVPAYREQLILGGSRSTVPCLLIQQADGSDQWLYESQAIIDYLEGRFSR